MVDEVEEGGQMAREGESTCTLRREE